jgi:2-polyprenyl-6-methoxyphenol hydroxylase-like FAD-dependent oxidoreductase
VPVLIVGAGPTGLALAIQLQRFGTPFRIIDRTVDRTRESRALAVQARTLELFDSVGLADRLVSSGRTGTRLVLHFGARPLVSLTLGDIGATDTRFPFILFVSQAETERLLNERLEVSGITIERGTELLDFELQTDRVVARLRRADGTSEQLATTFLVGSDGAHSVVRKGAGFSFEGGSYPQDFVLGDVEAAGPLEEGAINSYAGGGGVAMFFPLGSPTTWRVIAMREPRGRGAKRERRAETQIEPLTLEELQEVVDPPTEGSIRIFDPAWLTHFRLHHRQIACYRRGRVFLAGDAAHIHSPVGAQGMNTGIQDAWNLGWKLALVSNGTAKPELLDSYNEERWPIGQFLLRYTDRLFSTFTRAMSPGRITSWVREQVVSRLVPRILASRRLRARAFRFVSELGIHYRNSPAVAEGRPRLRRGPRAGERLPDAQLMLNGQHVSLQQTVVGPFLTVLLCGPVNAWNQMRVTTLPEFGPLLRVFYVTQGGSSDALVDAQGATLRRLGVRHSAQYLIRPDGHVAFRCSGTDLKALERYVERWYLHRRDA